MATAKPFIMVKSSHQVNVRTNMGSKKEAFNIVRAAVRKFFEQDDVSVQAPGINDCITRRKVKKQKQYLSNSLKCLFRKFCEESECVISLSAFCNLHPFWVVPRNVHQRDTCLCYRCENMNFLYQALKREKVLCIVEVKNAKNDLDTLLRSQMCCSPIKLECFYRTCTDCENLFFDFAVFDGNERTYYNSWQSVTEPRGRNGQCIKTTAKTQI